MVKVEQSIPHSHIKSVTERHKPQLSGLLRYARFIESETPEVWERLLGPDVVGLTHPDVTAEITEKFIAHNAESGLALLPEEQILLLTAGWLLMGKV